MQTLPILFCTRHSPSGFFRQIFDLSKYKSAIRNVISNTKHIYFYSPNLYRVNLCNLNKTIKTDIKPGIKKGLEMRSNKRRLGDISSLIITMMVAN